MATPRVLTDGAEIGPQPCPQCGASMPVHVGYVTWCDQCGWNLRPEQPKRRSLQARLYRAYSQRHAQAMNRQVTAHAGSVRPPLTPALLVAYALATVVHGVTLALVILAGWLIIAGWSSFVSVILGLFVLFAAWALRPRMMKLPRDPLTREAAPTIHAICDRIAQALGMPGVDVIALDGSFGASLYFAGWGRRHVLTAGLPLLWVLDRQETVALLAHELAHAVNGDPARGRYLAVALDTLATWYAWLAPNHIWAPGSGLLGLFVAPYQIAMFLISSGIRLIHRALVLLLWQNSQRAEYLADRLAAQVAGAPAALALLQRLDMEGSYNIALARIAASNEKQDFFDTFRRLVQAAPPREWERIRRLHLLEDARLDDSHPPTFLREEALRALPETPAQVEISEAEAERMAQELAPLKPKVQKEMVDRRRRSLHA